MSYINDGDSWGLTRPKLNNLNSLFRVAVTDEAIPASAVTSIPIADFDGPDDILLSGDALVIESLDSGDLTSIALTADISHEATSLTVASVTPAAIIPAGSSVYISVLTLLTILRP